MLVGERFTLQVSMANGEAVDLSNLAISATLGSDIGTFASQSAQEAVLDSELMTFNVANLAVSLCHMQS